MTKKLRIELPQNCFTREYLEQSGIHCEYSILDTAFINGPGRTFYSWCAVFCVPVIFLVLDSLWLHIMSPALLYLLICILVVSLAGCAILLSRYFLWLHIRNSIRHNLPITVEPFAIMLIPSRSDLLDSVNFSFSRTAVIYKECGTRKPRFYMGAVRTGMVKELPAGIALLYRHTSLEYYYSIDSEFELKKTWDLGREIAPRSTIVPAS